MVYLHNFNGSQSFNGAIQPIQHQLLLLRISEPRTHLVKTQNAHCNTKSSFGYGWFALANKYSPQLLQREYRVGKKNTKYYSLDHFDGHCTRRGGLTLAPGILPFGPCGATTIEVSMYYRFDAHTKTVCGTDPPAQILQCKFALQRSCFPLGLLLPLLPPPNQARTSPCQPVLLYY